MKYIIILGDGMSDYPIDELNNKTPLQYADKPTMDYFAKHGEMGLVKTIPDGISPGSDIANLSVMGYDPHKFYSGRSPLEAVSIGVKLSDYDISFRCNLVTLSEHSDYNKKIMIDHSSDEISSEEAKILIEYINKELSTPAIKFFPGVSYRHLLVWAGGPYDFNFTPPHDILDRRINNYLPKGPHKDIFLEMMRKSNKLLTNHFINKERIKKGLKPANSIWIWGEGKKPQLSSFTEKYKIKGSVISAVDLIKGIGLCAGLSSIDVEGATGNINTNFHGKAVAALDEIKKGIDFVYIHIEAPDESGHRNEMDNKIKAIELIDQKIIRTIKQELDNVGEDYRIMVLPDHPTPLSLRTHTSDPVPFVVFDNKKIVNNSIRVYDEDSASQTGIFIDEGHKLMDYFILGEIK
jgi:2,3-bisphosphoglycerate-independent phosphoglycerate mutase